MSLFGNQQFVASEHPVLISIKSVVLDLSKYIAWRSIIGWYDICVRGVSLRPVDTL